MQLRSTPPTAAALAAALFALLPDAAAAPDATSTTLVSRSTTGEFGDFNSGVGGGRTIAVSDSGRFVAFTSEATNLVPGDTNLRRDVFLRDRELGTTVRVSVGDQGQQGDGNCSGVAVSNDGRFVAFGSDSTNLVPNDSNNTVDVFLWDATTGTSRLVSQTPTGASGDSRSEFPSMDGLGRRIVFQSRATDLVAGDSNGFQDVFVWERATGAIELVSVSSTGAPSTGVSANPYLARDGRYVAFETGATWDPMDPNNLADIYVRDIDGGTTELVGGQPGGYNAAVRDPAISMGGRYVTFATSATNVIPTNQNGLSDVYRADRQTGVIEQVSLATNGDQPNDASFAGDISVDGAWVAFESNATNIDPSVTSSASLFVRRVDQEWTELVSVSHAGDPLVFPATDASIGGDGRFVAFRTGDTSAVPGDPYGYFDVVMRDRGFGTRSAGGTYCQSTPNSTGVMAEMAVVGSNKLAAQQLVLGAEFLPQNSLGYFLFSQDTGDVLGFGGSQGRLCLGGSIFRLSNFIQSSGANGAVALPLPFGQLPPAATLAAGESWNFQYWFRDTSGGQATSNTSSAVCVPLY